MSPSDNEGRMTRSGVHYGAQSMRARSEVRKDLAAYKATRMYDDEGNPKWGTPESNHMKLALAKYSAKETNKGLGSGVEAWVERFVRELERAQMASGFCWNERVKIDALEAHLEGKALRFIEIERRELRCASLTQALNNLKTNFKATLSDTQAMDILGRMKPEHVGYKEHLTYLRQVNEAGGGHYSRNVLKSIVHKSGPDGPDLTAEIASKYDKNRMDYIEHAIKLAEFADELWNERNLQKNAGRYNREDKEKSSEKAKARANAVESKKVL
jgi:hypothetical protein